MKVWLVIIRTGKALERVLLLQDERKLDCDQTLAVGKCGYTLDTGNHIPQHSMSLGSQQTFASESRQNEDRVKLKSPITNLAF